MIAVVGFTRKGIKLGSRIVCGLREFGLSSKGYQKGRRSVEDEKMVLIEEALTEWTGKHFSDVEGFVFVGAAGIAVRAVAPWLKDKYSDPAVVVVDEKGQFVIPILSGHMGGGNALARQIAAFLHALPVLTTATDVREKFAIDVFAKENRLWISNRETAKQISAELLDGGSVGITSAFPLEGNFPRECCAGKAGKYQVEIDIFRGLEKERRLFLVPKIVTLGIGCRKGIAAEKLEQQIVQYLEEKRIWRQAVEQVATVEQKKEEPALLEICRKFGWKFIWFDAKTLSTVDGDFSYSSFVEKTVGVGNVCERAAVLGSGGGADRLMMKKQILEGMTVAAAQKKITIRI